MRISDYANPRQVILVSSRDKDQDNIITLAWHMPLSFEPMMYAIALGTTRYSYKMIKDSGVFVVNFMSLEYKDQVLECGSVSGHEHDKFAEFGLTKEEADKISCPVIGEASSYLECKIKEEVIMGDHAIFMADVLKAEKKDDKDRIFQISGEMFGTIVKPDLTEEDDDDSN
ncbi:MAG: flavin reductase family protein [Patescibacteria group bacterium]